MKMNSLHPEANSAQWNRKLLQTFWIFLLVSIVLEAGNLYFTRLPLKSYVLHFILLPTALLILILLACEAVFRFWNRYSEVCLIVASVLMSTVMFSIHFTVPPIYASLFIPGLVSVYFFEESKVPLAYGLCMVAYLIVFDVRMEQNQASMGDAFTMLGELGLGYFLTTQIVQRGIQIVEHLRQSIEAKQELMVRTTIMEKLAKTDLLTGLYNHLTFHEYLKDLLEQCDRCGFQVHLAIFDIDNFKKVNDIFGHRSGDIILQRVAKTIKEHVTPDDFVSRYGGEEFAVIFTDKSKDEVFHLLDRIREAIAQCAHDELDGRCVTVSIGVNTYQRGMGKEELFKGADEALYEAKKTGKNKTVGYQRL
jgi:diguanylate cyclase (GGDEF)-like protein